MKDSCSGEGRPPRPKNRAYVDTIFDITNLRCRWWWRSLSPDTTCESCSRLHSRTRCGGSSGLRPEYKIGRWVSAKKITPHHIHSYKKIEQHILSFFFFLGFSVYKETWYDAAQREDEICIRFHGVIIFPQYLEMVCSALLSFDSRSSSFQRPDLFFWNIMQYFWKPPHGAKKCVSVTRTPPTMCFKWKVFVFKNRVANAISDPIKKGYHISRPEGKESVDFEIVLLPFRLTFSEVNSR